MQRDRTDEQRSEVRAVFEIKPDCLYSLEDLERELGALGLSARQFLDQVKPPKLFRNVWRGADILEALTQYRRRREAARRIALRPRKGRARKDEIELIPMPTE